MFSNNTDLTLPQKIPIRLYTKCRYISGLWGTHHAAARQKLTGTCQQGSPNLILRANMHLLALLHPRAMQCCFIMNRFGFYLGWNNTKLPKYQKTHIYQEKTDFKIPADIPPPTPARPTRAVCPPNTRIHAKTTKPYTAYTNHTCTMFDSQAKVNSPANTTRWHFSIPMPNNYSPTTNLRPSAHHQHSCKAPADLT